MLFKKYNRLLVIFKKQVFSQIIMIESLKLEKENIINNIRNTFQTRKEIKAIKDRTIRDIQNSFEHEEEKNYYKPVRVFGVKLILNTKTMRSE